MVDNSKLEISKVKHEVDTIKPHAGLWRTTVLYWVGKSMPPVAIASVCPARTAT